MRGSTDYADGRTGREGRGVRVSGGSGGVSDVCLVGLFDGVAAEGALLERLAALHAAGWLWDPTGDGAWLCFFLGSRKCREKIDLRNHH